MGRSLQKLVFLAGIWAASAPSSQAASDQLNALLGCRGIADAGARLVCFDREAAAGPASSASLPTPSPLRPSPVTPAVTSAAAAAPAQPVLNPQQQFGLPEQTIAAKEVAAGLRASEAVKIDAHIVKVATAADRRMVFTLDDDQVWRQLTASGDLLANLGDAVTISRGLLGSYWLQLKSGRGCKVTRLH